MPPLPPVAVIPPEPATFVPPEPAVDMLVTPPLPATVDEPPVPPVASDPFAPSSSSDEHPAIAPTVININAVITTAPHARPNRFIGSTLFEPDHLADPRANPSSPQVRRV
jgi:hypothetical protein